MNNNEENFEIHDDSNDRKYFSILPNYILNHSTALAQSLYMQLKRYAGEKGLAYPSMDTLIQKMGISKPTLRKELKYLINKGWITFAGYVDIPTKGGMQKLKSYRMVDLWELNNDYYVKGGKNRPAPDTKGGKNTTGGGEKIAPLIRFTNQEENNTSKPNFSEQVQIIKAFKDVNRAYKKWLADPKYLDACTRLVEQHGFKEVMDVIGILPQTNFMPYITTIINPLQLEDKWSSLEAGLSKKKGEIKSKGRGLATDDDTI